MVSKNQIKHITSLHQKKYRQQAQLFIAEGKKVIEELLNSNYELEQLLITENVFDDIKNLKKERITNLEMKKISCLSTPSNCLAIFKIKPPTPITTTKLIVALDAVRDPGNLGTIIRLCDWFGIGQLLCSEETVEVYNPKVIMATMGSIARVQVHYVNLENFISNAKLPVYGTFMNGNNIYTEKLPQEGIIVLGNEANGISQNIEKKITHKISIPRFSTQTESLNVATATAIVLSEFKRINYNN